MNAEFPMTPKPESNGDLNGNDAERVRRAYRSATENLNESPSAAVRAAVLAAAARAVQARPTAVTTHGVAPALRGRPRWRMPLAAAASVLVGTMAVLLAQRTEENLPAQGDAAQVAVRAGEPAPPVVSAEPKAVDAAPAAVAATPPDRARQLADADATRRQQFAQSAGEQQRRANETGPQETAPAIAAQEHKLIEQAAPASAPAVQLLEKREAETATGRVSAQLSQADRREPAGLAAKASESVAAPQSVRSESAAGSAAERDAAAPATPKKDTRGDEPPRTPQPASAPVPAAPPPERVIGRPVQRTAPIAEAQGLAARIEPAEVSPAVVADPARWLDRIMRLRAEGRHDLADAELKSLRARYPDVVIPRQALRD